MVKRKGAKVGVVRVGGCKVFTEAQVRGTRAHLPGEMVRNGKCVRGDVGSD
ncbi:MAG: hypothetical protein V3U33_00420 [candidate division NC10 bacterium]